MTILNLLALLMASTLLLRGVEELKSEETSKEVIGVGNRARAD